MIKKSNKKIRTKIENQTKLNQTPKDIIIIVKGIKKIAIKRIGTRLDNKI